MSGSLARRGLASVASTTRPAPKQLRLVLLGAPGSGKGTHAANLEKTFDTQTIIAGDLLRSEINNGSDIGRQAERIMRDGGLVPDDVMQVLLQNALDASSQSDLVFDGYPRNVHQAKQLDALLSARQEELNLVVHLDVPDEVILERIEGRWVHNASGRVYNTTFNPPKTPGLDDVTGEPLTKRVDDDPVVYAKRLVQFHAQTAPVLDYYRQRRPTLVETVSGTTSKIIWPKLERVIRERFGGYQASKI